MANVRPLYVPLPYQDAADSGRLILRDGSTATLRVGCSEDRPALRAFFQQLPTEARWRRFFSLALPSPELLDSLCDGSDPEKALTLLVLRSTGPLTLPCPPEDGGQGRVRGERIIATGSYQRVKDQTAEIAFAVNDAFRGKGLGTLLLERLAVLAARHGFVRFWAVTHADNLAMSEVFRESGFQIKEKLEGGYLEFQLSVAPTEASVERSEMRDRIATAASLRPFFVPASVAVIGVSRNPLNLGRRIFQALLENRFQGPVYPVNPQAAEIDGRRVYAAVADLPEPVDLAVIAVPRDRVLTTIDDCARRGVRAVVVISAGFAEADTAGRELQKQVLDKVRGYGLRMIGPNCMGLLNTDPRVCLNASFSPVFPPHGSVAMSSQSGALGLAILAAARRLNLGLSTFVSVGNKADVSSNDLIQYWEDDPQTEVILLYLESFGNPRRFARLARRVSRRKPIVAVKAGRTTAGSRAAGSHTAALAASDVSVEALFHHTGVLRAETLEEMFDLAAALGSQPLPPGRRVAVVTNAGGPGILCADACEANGLQVPELTGSTRSKLAAFLPAAAGLGNPVDMIASAGPEDYTRTIEAVLAAAEIDALIVIYIPLGLAETATMARAVLDGVARGRAAGGSGKPVLACLMAEEGIETQLVQENERIPTYAFPEAAARALGKAAVYREWRSQPLGMTPDYEDMDFAGAREICRQALAQRGPGWLSTDETRRLLTCARLPVAAGGVARTGDEAVQLARELAGPVAVKLASHQLVHKTEIGGIRLNLRDAQAVRRAFDEIRDRLTRNNQLDAMEGVLVQPMIADGVEVMVGVTEDAMFGPLIAFGLGGIHVEILADVCFRVTPLTDRDAREMVRSIRGYRLLEGYRGHAPADVEAIEEVLLRISRLVDEIPEISELDLNPIFALAPGKGCSIVDARIRVQAM
jgi:acetyl coenzyme A synthetase (ADP forming)-like protein